MARPPEGLPAALSPCTLADAPADSLLALSDEAGWNQTEADWRRLLRCGRGFGLAAGGRPVASAVLLPYDAGIAWISMVLVTAAWRRHGLARHLMHEAMQACRALGRTAVLDATPAGEPVYRDLGFEAGLSLTRWHRPGAAAGPPPTAEAEAPLPAEAVARDARAMGAPRGVLLNALAADGHRVLHPRGSLLLRPGRRAWHLGPLLAETHEAAHRLLAAGLDLLGTAPAVADARDGCALEPVLAAQGFAAQRPFRRMHLGAAPDAEPELLWLTAGPEFG